MKNKIEDLRNHLFLSLEKLQDATNEELPIEVDRSLMIIEVSKQIIDTARVENEFIQITQKDENSFIPPQKQIEN